MKQVCLVCGEKTVGSYKMRCPECGSFNITESTHTKYKLVDYFDVWGNEEDGWEVNNLATIEEGIWIFDDADDQEVLDYMVTIGWLKSSKAEDIYLVSDCEGMIEFFQTVDDMPLGRLEIMD